MLILSMLPAVIFLRSLHSALFVSGETVSCASFQMDGLARDGHNVMLNFSINTSNCSSLPPTIHHITVTAKDPGSTSMPTPICQILNRDGSCTSSPACTCDAVTQQYTVIRRVGNGNTEELWELAGGLDDGRSFSMLVDISNVLLNVDEAADEQESPPFTHTTGFVLLILGVVGLLALAIVVIIVRKRRGGRGRRDPTQPRIPRSLPQDDDEEEEVAERWPRADGVPAVNADGDCDSMYEEVANPQAIRLMHCLSDRDGYLYPVRAGHRVVKKKPPPVPPTDPNDEYVL